MILNLLYHWLARPGFHDGRRIRSGTNPYFLVGGGGGLPPTPGHQHTVAAVATTTTASVSVARNFDEFSHGTSSFPRGMGASKSFQSHLLLLQQQNGDDIQGGLNVYIWKIPFNNLHFNL